LRWNNPRLHTPDRRKTWLACGAHRESLGGFLQLRGFLQEVCPMAPAAGGGASSPSTDANPADAGGASADPAGGPALAGDAG